MNECGIVVGFVPPFVLISFQGTPDLDGSEVGKILIYGDVHSPLPLEMPNGARISWEVGKVSSLTGYP
jgi:hypothetical protein